ncbi:DUF6069 family protein [Kutzneria buriramensis]|uniref:Uncharacterized protein n=1 Tax=Kutzneria buriramensis TaxID=1045776 RepID=A0A3E0HVD9_9PSEU|nr:DUF6069 family protein [Kutzneria buriramensis]REH49935.1 hypothetical protein BCF44_104201 [Kutzneria buriramensis]
MSTHAHPHTDTSTLRVAIGVLAAAVVSIAVNTGIALGTIALDPSGTRMGLDLVAYAPLTIIGVLAGTVGWAVIRRYAAHARATLRVVVPLVVVLSFIPDLGLLISGTADGVNVAGLLVMHVVVATVTVATASRVLPLVGYRRTV